MPEDPYSDPVTGVLYNKLGLGTAAGLEAAEREITHAALILVDESPVSPSYDLPHLQEIHKRIFGDIYEWAGQIRTVAIAKGAMFCLPQYIDSWRPRTDARDAGRAHERQHLTIPATPAARGLGSIDCFRSSRTISACAFTIPNAATTTGSSSSPAGRSSSSRTGSVVHIALQFRRLMVWASGLPCRLRFACGIRLRFR